MPDINWNGDAASAPLKSRFDEASENLILAEDQNGDVALFEWDGTAWQFRGPVEMNGEDVSGIGALTATNVVADSVNTGSASISNYALPEGGNRIVANQETLSNESISVSDYETGDKIIVECLLEDKSSSTNALELRLDGLSEEDYVQTLRQGTTTASTTETEFTLIEIRSGSGSYGEWTVSNDTGSPRAMISGSEGVSARSLSQDWLWNGYFDDSADADQLEFSTRGDVSGWIEVTHQPLNGGVF